MPKILTEKSSALSYIKEDMEDNKHYLGKLAGIGAEFNKPTRNGRRYPIELWRNIEKSDDFKEGMETHTIFGECDHPETRIETSIKEIAIVLTKYEIRENEGNVYTEFHILDTPNGRILKELLDYGSQIGVSTRGLGDEIVKDGETIIDPDTYCFYGWDAVVMPAVKSARPAVVESKKKSLIESFNKEIDSATSIYELNSLRRMVDKMPELDSLKESINIKLNSINGGEDISSKLEEDLGKISEDNVRLTEEIESLRAELVANNIRIKELKRINNCYRESTKSLRGRLQERMLSTAKLEDSIYDSAIETSEITELLESTRDELNETSRKLSKSERNNDRLSNKLETINSELLDSRRIIKENISKSRTLEENIANLNNRLSLSRKEIENLRNKNAILEESNKKLSEQIKSNTSKQVLTEKKSAKELSSYKKALAEKSSVISETLEKYLKTKCAQNGIKLDTVQRLLPTDYTTEDIDRIVSDLADRKRRYESLPFALPIQSAKIVESSNMSDEDMQTMAFLKESCNN